MTARRRALWITGASTIVLLAILGVIEGPMKDGGHGIIDFELAGSAAEARTILGDWGDRGRDAALLSLLVDYPFLLAYSAFLFLLQRYYVGRVAAVLAGVCDAFENLALLLVRGGNVEGWPEVAQAFALTKFAALGFAIAAALVGLVRSRRS